MRRTGLAVLVLLALAGMAMGVQAQGDDGLVAEWRFDEGSGSVLKDSSGNGNDGTIYGATWVDGKVGQALRFDGQNDYIKVPYSESLHIHGSFAIELWVYIEGNQGTYRELISNRGSGRRGDYTWVLMISPDNKFRYYVGGIHSGTCVFHSKNETINTWYHVVLIRDSRVGKIYLNGKLDNSMPSISMGDMRNDIAIGYDIMDGVYPFNGIIDEIRIYNRALTADEIKAHYELVGTTYRTPAVTTSTPFVRIISAPSTIHGGEDVEVTVGWENIPSNWKLVVSLEKSDTDKDRLADDVERTISGTGEAVFKLNTYQIDETYDRALVWASLLDESDNWKSIYTNAGITVLPAATRAPPIAATSEPSPVRARTPALVDRIATPTPTRKPDVDPDMLKLAGGAIIVLIAIAIVLLAVKLREKRRNVPEEPPAPEETKTTPQPEPTPRPAPPEPTPALGPVPIPTQTGVSAAIEVRRGYEVLPNNDIRFGIRVINPTPYLIADVETILDYDKTLFSLKGDRVRTLANIHPNGERTAKYVLKPRGCVHNEKIDATIIYRDHLGKRRTIQMRGKEVHCVCPFLKENPMREGEFAEFATKSEHIEEGLSFSGIGPSEIAAFIKESCTHRLHTVGEHEIDNTISLNLAGESIGEETCYLLTAVVQPYKEKDITQIALRAYSDKPHGLHGFLNEITASIRHLVGSVQSAKEIGIIEEKQVINIIDSVVQRTSFGGVGQGANTAVNIKDSVVHRNNIGGGNAEG